MRAAAENAAAEKVAAEKAAAEKAAAEKAAAEKAAAEKAAAERTATEEEAPLASTSCCNLASTSCCKSKQQAMMSCWSCDELFATDDQGYIPEHNCAETLPCVRPGPKPPMVFTKPVRMLDGSPVWSPRPK